MSSYDLFGRMIQTNLKCLEGRVYISLTLELPIEIQIALLLEAAFHLLHFHEIRE